MWVYLWSYMDLIGPIRWILLVMYLIWWWIIMMIYGDLYDNDDELWCRMDYVIESLWWWK
jgi:hypothetical protein